VPPKKILIYGYGNPGRQDDGLGNAFVQRLEKWIKQEHLEGFEFDSNYQLNIEDAANIAGKDLVVFVDASEEQIDDFILTPVNSSANVTFTTHAASPGYIVKLCRELYNENPATYLLHIKGFEWDFKEGLSVAANDNLEKSLVALKIQLKNPDNLIQSYTGFEN
jgi:hydrogenase maturation protease